VIMTMEQSISGIPRISTRLSHNDTTTEHDTIGTYVGLH
jgi:hypothetical protein